MIENEREHGLGQLQKSLDPFRKDHGGEKLRMLGRYNFCIQMADPSVKFLESISNNLIGTLSSDSLEQLRYDAYNAAQNPNQFFTQQGIRVHDSEKLEEGAVHAGLLLDDFVSRYDYKTSKLWEYNLNPKVFAEVLHEKIQLRKGERQVEKFAKKVKEENNLKKRVHMGLDLKRQVLDYIGSFPFTFSSHSHDHLIEPTWENLILYSGLSTDLKTKDGGSSWGSFSLEEAVDVAQAAILRDPFEERLERLPSKDRERFDKLRLQYGAKAANLIILSELTGDINRLAKGFGHVRLNVPDFRAVPVDSYRSWKKGELLDDSLRTYFEWANKLRDDDYKWDPDKRAPAEYMVRSSAVFSEDGENVTGAGIYESLRVQGGGSFQDFKDAVIRVYKSTDSPQAQAYRKQHGIEREEMGLIIQKYISPDGHSFHNETQKGYINSRLIGVPQLMEITTVLSRNFINRKELDFFLALDGYGKHEAFQTVHHFPPDHDKINSTLPIVVAQLTSVLERIWGRAIQVEFVAKGLDINFVQVRELPANTLSQGPEIQFPGEEPIRTGASIGVGDMVLPVLDRKSINREKIGAVEFGTNYGWTTAYGLGNLPKEGAVIIYNYGGSNGHIQTICAEKGLICIFPNGNEADDPTSRDYDLSTLKKIRVVSNGIEGRIYKI